MSMPPPGTPEGAPPGATTTGETPSADPPIPAWDREDDDGYTASLHQTLEPLMPPAPEPEEATNVFTETEEGLLFNSRLSGSQWQIDESGRIVHAALDDPETYKEWVEQYGEDQMAALRASRDKAQGELTLILDHQAEQAESAFDRGEVLRGPRERFEGAVQAFAGRAADGINSVVRQVAMEGAARYIQEFVEAHQGEYPRQVLERAAKQAIASSADPYTALVATSLSDPARLARFIAEIGRAARKGNATPATGGGGAAPPATEKPVDYNEFVLAQASAWGLTPEAYQRGIEARKNGIQL